MDIFQPNYGIEPSTSTEVMSVAQGGTDDMPRPNPSNPAFDNGQTFVESAIQRHKMKIVAIIIMAFVIAVIVGITRPNILEDR